MPLHSLDFLILLALAIGVVRGVWTGAVHQIISILGVVLAVILAIELMRPVGELIGSALGISDALWPAVGILAVFVVIQIIAFFATRMIESLIKILRLTVANRAVGGAVGLGKAALLLSVLFVVLAFFDVPQEEDRRRSALYPYVAGVLPESWDYVSEHLPLIRSLSERIGVEARSVLEGGLPSGEKPAGN